MQEQGQTQTFDLILQQQRIQEGFDHMQEQDQTETF